MNEIAIIGAGPAGIAAAIQLGRYGITPLIFEKDSPGGLLINANLVENYPGFPRGISGVQLVEIFRKELVNAGIGITTADIQKVKFIEDCFILDSDQSQFKSKHLIIASGTKPVKLHKPDVSRLFGNRVFYEVQPLANVSGCDIAIIGAGDAAFDYAINLATGNSITINNRSTRRSCLPLLWERTIRIDSINYRSNAILQDIKLTGNNVQVTWDIAGNTVKETVDYLLVAIGRLPNLDFLGEGIRNNLPNLEQDKRLFLIGDIKNGIYRQTGISVGDGIKAAMTLGNRICKTLKCE